MSEQHEHSFFSSTDAVDVTEYPRVSRSAVVALILGLLSVAAVSSQVMWILPLAGVVVSVAALCWIARSEPTMIGRWAAVVGLALSLLFGTWAPLRYYVRWDILSDDARQHATEWLSYIQNGQLREAHQLQMQRSDRQRPDVDLAKFYEESEDIRVNFKEFRNTPCIVKIAKLGQTAHLRYVRDEGFTFESAYGRKADVVTQRFAIEFDEEGVKRILPVSIEMVHVREHNRPEDFWYVRSCERIEDEGDWAVLDPSGMSSLPKHKRRKRCSG